MPREIEFVDGNTNTVVSRTPFEQVPPQNREVYLKDGVRVSHREEADEVVPIARVVKLAIDAEGRPAAKEDAVRVIIQEFDAEGHMRRETIMVKPA